MNSLFKQQVPQNQGFRFETVPSPSAVVEYHSGGTRKQAAEMEQKA
ncbi:hypothetical protein [Chroococcidiopsis sp. CCMEE 29]|nr:hypothetical protein [Chroococcidiopsis sp. CCMEE 29]